CGRVVVAVGRAVAPPCDLVPTQLRVDVRVVESCRLLVVLLVLLVFAVVWVPSGLPCSAGLAPTYRQPRFDGPGDPSNSNQDPWNRQVLAHGQGTRFVERLVFLEELHAEPPDEVDQEEYGNEQPSRPLLFPSGEVCQVEREQDQKPQAELEQLRRVAERRFRHADVVARKANAP